MQHDIPSRRYAMRQGIVALCLWTAAACACAAPPPAIAPPGSPAVASAPYVKAALEDAARHTGRPLEELKVIAVTPVTWSDGSLGCPEAGLMYPQMLVPGFRITIEAAGQQLDYHASKLGAVVLCPPERAVKPAAPPGAG